MTALFFGGSSVLPAVASKPKDSLPWAAGASVQDIVNSAELTGPDLLDRWHWREYMQMHAALKLPARSLVHSNANGRCRFDVKIFLLQLAWIRWPGLVTSAAPSLDELGTRVAAVILDVCQPQQQFRTASDMLQEPQMVEKWEAMFPGPCEASIEKILNGAHEPRLLAATHAWRKKQRMLGRSDALIRDGSQLRRALYEMGFLEVRRQVYRPSDTVALLRAPPGATQFWCRSWTCWRYGTWRPSWWRHVVAWALYRQQRVLRLRRPRSAKTKCWFCLYSS